jgi:hypothetical protein
MLRTYRDEIPTGCPVIPPGGACGFDHFFFRGASNR